MNMNRFVRRLSGQRDDGAFVRLTTPIDPTPTAGNAALDRQRAFAEELIPALAVQWPSET